MPEKTPEKREPQLLRHSSHDKGPSQDATSAEAKAQLDAAPGKIKAAQEEVEKG